MRKFHKMEFSALVLPMLCSLFTLSPTQREKQKRREKTQMCEQTILPFSAIYELSIINFQQC